MPVCYVGNLVDTYLPIFSKLVKYPVFHMFLVILRQGLASSNVTITQSSIVPSYTDIVGSYIVYLPPLSVVAVLDLQGNQKSRVYSYVWIKYTNVHLGYG